MPLNYENLTEETRVLMEAELDLDLRSETLYLPKTLTYDGLEAWPDLLREAIQHGDDATLAEAIEHVLRPRDARGRRTPVDAAAKLADGEFNRLYIRAQCMLALERGEDVEVYRAKEARDPRFRSVRLVGTLLDASELLHDLRINTGMGTMLGVPGGPNSGISVRLPLAKRRLRRA
ncbi:MAG: hypothetical protein H6736_23915 [Alphaproteobacteria bacterium]|nr:hypothetical protein [Myxococcales bacterium]MCB9694867.1 hypothetical protein [Alphaproteobacteria bacterium]